MEKKEKKTSVAEKSIVIVNRGKNIIKNELKGLEEKGKNIKPKASTQESKDSQIEKK
jgi:hypothetical protein